MKLLKFAAIISLLVGGLYVQGQTLNLNDSTIVISSPHRTGMNIGCRNFYENCQTDQNLLNYNNPGFEPGETRRIEDVTSTTGTATTFTDVNQFGTDPTNYMAGATFQIVESINGGAENGCTGTVASNTGPNRSYVNAWSWDGTSIVTFTPDTGSSSWVVGTSTVTIPQLPNGGFLVNKTGTVTAQGGGTFSVTLSSPPTHVATSSNDWGFVQTSTTYSAPVYTLNSTTNQGSAGCASTIKRGDIILLDKVNFPTSEHWWEGGYGGVFNSAVSGGAQMLSDTTDLCSTCGSQALNLSIPTPGGSASFFSFYDTNPNEDIFTIMKGTFQLSFWAKGTGTSVLTATPSRSGSSGFSCGPYTPALTSTWTQYNFNCIASETPGLVGPSDGNAGVKYQATNPSGTGSVYIDNLSFKKISPVNSANTSVFRDELMQAFYDLNTAPCSAPSTIRFWIDQNSETIDNWTRPNYARYPTGTGYAVAPGGQASYQMSLNDFLGVVANVATVTGCPVEPYIEFPVTVTTTDAQNLVEFLAAPSTATGSAYGQRRVALGQTAAWTSVFSNINLTFCNECWNGSFVYQNIQGDSSGAGTVYHDYAVRTQHVFAAMRADSYYPSNIQLNMDFQTQNPSTADAAIALARPDGVEIEDYNYGSVGSFATPAALYAPLYFEVYLQTVSSTDPHNFYRSWNDYKNLSTCGASGTSICHVNIYEQGEGTISGTIASSQVDEDHITAGAGYGLAAALQFLLHQQNAPNVFFRENFFAATEFRNGTTGSATAKLWGSLMEAGGASAATNGVPYTSRPALVAMQMANKSVIGSMFSCPITSGPTYTFPGSSTNGPSGTLPSLSGVPYLFAFCFKNGSSRSVILFNTDTVNSYTVGLAGTNLPTGTITQRGYNIASNPNSLNEANTGTYTGNTAITVQTTSTPVSAPTSINVAPYSITALDYVASGLPQAAQPTFSLPSGTYIGPQTVTVSSTTPGAVIHISYNGTLYIVYSGPVTISSTTPFYAYTSATGYSDSIVSFANYTIQNPQAATPVFSPLGGTYTSTQTVTVTDSTPSSSIFCTTDGTTPTPSSPPYTGAFTVAISQTISCIATAPSFSPSVVSVQIYTINAGGIPGTLIKGEIHDGQTVK